MLGLWFASPINLVFDKAFKLFWALSILENKRLSLRNEAKSILAVVAPFFVFQLFLFLKSFQAEYSLYLRYIARIETGNPFWTSFWFSSELIGEVGLILRFAGACFVLVFVLFLARKGEAIFSNLARAVVLEGMYYLFNLPFIVSLFARPNTSIVNVEAGLSYALQIVFVAPAFLILYFKVRKPTSARLDLYKWGAVALIGFTFGLWVKHFLLNLYALPIDIADPVLLIGLINSAFTMLFAGLILAIALLPIIRKESGEFSSRLVGIGLLLVGTYVLIYLLISLVNQIYLNFLTLTDVWAIAYLVAGIGFIRKRTLIIH